MERHFENLEEAELFAARMRSEGHRADVLSESVPTLWGAAAIGDIKVVVYDLPDVEETPPAPSRSADLAERLVYGTVVGAMLIVFGWVALETAAYLFKDGPVGALLKVLAALSVVYALSAWSLLLSALFRKGRDPDSKMGLFVHALTSVIAVVLSLTMLVTDFRLW